MGQIISWIMIVEYVGIIGFMPTYLLFKSFKDRGYSFMKPIGLLFVSYAIWLIGTAGLLPNSQATGILVMLVLSLVSVVLFFKNKTEVTNFVKNEWRVILFSEVLFLVVLCIWLIYRLYDPSINTTEKPMDFAFLNAVINTNSFPPNDPWLIGNNITYYYFGYLIMGTLALVAGISASIAYNLSLALVAALSATAIFGLVLNLAWDHKHNLREAMAVGLFASFVLIGIGNLEGILEWLTRVMGLGSEAFLSYLDIDGLKQTATSPTFYPNSLPADHMWWWRATRVIGLISDGYNLDFTITEFPFFSALLGDLHPHYIVIPFLITCVALAFAIYKSNMLIYVQPGYRWILNTLPNSIMISICLGSLGFLNTWVLPTGLILLFSSIVFRGYIARKAASKSLQVNATLITVYVSLVVLAGSFIAYLPFYLSLQPQISGIRILSTFVVPGHDYRYGTRPAQCFLIWGLFALLVMPILLKPLMKSCKTALLLLLVGLIYFLYCIVASPFIVLGLIITPLVFGLCLAFILTLWTTFKGIKNSEESGLIFVGILLAISIGLIIGPEILYVDDYFPRRMNTIFKLYYQAWVLLSVVGSLSLIYCLQVVTKPTLLKTVSRYSWFAGVIVLTIGSFYYVPASMTSKSEHFGLGYPTLNGLAYIGVNTEEYMALQWLQSNVRTDEGVLEAISESYGGLTGDQRGNRVSSSTGIPTILGWPGHELQWRGSSVNFDYRRGAVDTIYEGKDINLALELLDEFQVQYVYVGSLEKEIYGEDTAERLGAWMSLAYPDKTNSYTTIMIYKIPE